MHHSKFYLYFIKIRCLVPVRHDFKVEPVSLVDFTSAMAGDG